MKSNFRQNECDLEIVIIFGRVKNKKIPPPPHLPHGECLLAEDRILTLL